MPQHSDHQFCTPSENYNCICQIKKILIVMTSGVGVHCHSELQFCTTFGNDFALVMFQNSDLCHVGELVDTTFPNFNFAPFLKMILHVSNLKNSILCDISSREDWGTMIIH